MSFVPSVLHQGNNERTSPYKQCLFGIYHTFYEMTLCTTILDNGSARSAGVQCKTSSK